MGHCALTARTWAAVGLTAILGACARQVPPRLASAYANLHGQEVIGTVRQMYDGTLSPDLAVTTFRNIDRLFAIRVVPHGNEPLPLLAAAKPLGAVTLMSGGTRYTLDDYVRLNRVAGLLVLKNGRVILERYEFGNTAQTRWMSMSVAKSMTSTLIGMAIKDGAIGSINDPVTRYVPTLVGSAYDGVSVRDVLMMSSGVRWNETYTDPSSDRRRLLEAQIAQQPGLAMALMRSLPRATMPGQANTYSTGETQVASEVLRGAIRKPLAEYLGEKLWRRLGMESDASWWLDSPGGHEIGGSGFSATLRDYGRFGLFVLQDGVIGRDSLLPRGWMADAGAPKTLSNGAALNYGYMWWPIASAPGTVNDGAFAAVGIFGQAIYVNRREQVVIVQWGAQTKPTGGAVLNENDFFAAVTGALR